MSAEVLEINKLLGRFVSHVSHPALCSSPVILPATPTSLSSPVHTAASPHMQSVQHLFTSSTFYQFTRLFLGVWDLPACSCLTSSYRPFLSLILLLRLPPGCELSFLISRFQPSPSWFLFARWNWSPGYCPYWLFPVWLCACAIVVLVPTSRLPWPSNLSVHCLLWTCCLSAKSSVNWNWNLPPCWVFCWVHTPLVTGWKRYLTNITATFLPTIYTVLQGNSKATCFSVSLVVLVQTKVRLWCPHWIKMDCT